MGGPGDPKIKTFHAHFVTLSPGPLWGSKWSQNGPNMEVKWRFNETKMDKNGANMEPRRNQNGAKLEAKCFQNRTRNRLHSRTIFIVFLLIV